MLWFSCLTMGQFVRQQVFHRWRHGSQSRQDDWPRWSDQWKLRSDFYSKETGWSAKVTKRALLVRLSLSAVCWRLAAHHRHDRRGSSVPLFRLSEAVGRSCRYHDAVHHLRFVQKEQQHPQGKVTMLPMRVTHRINQTADLMNKCLTLSCCNGETRADKANLESRTKLCTKTADSIAVELNET